MSTKVKSSVISEFNYNEKTSNLDITFNNGNIYRYKKVPNDDVQAMMNAKSVGTYFNNNIRDKYKSSKI